MAGSSRDALLCVRMICTCLILFITCKPHKETAALICVTLGVPDIYLTMMGLVNIHCVKFYDNYDFQKKAS